MARLASSHDAVHGRTRVPRRARRSAATFCLQQTERKESVRHRRVMIAAVTLPSVPEIRYLIARLLLAPIVRTSFILAWSRWRRRHQAIAANAHRRRRTELPL